MSKKIWIHSSVALLGLSPIALVAACNSVEANLLVATSMVPEITYSELNLSSNLQQAIGQINPQWVLEHKTKLFKGTTERLKTVQQISDFSVVNAPNQSLTITLTLAAGAYVDQTNQIGLIAQKFQTTITGFKTTQVDLGLIANQATFSVANKQQLASKVTPEHIIWNQAKDHPNVTFAATKSLPDDASGTLGFEAILTQNDDQTNQVNFVVDSASPQAIQGFEISQPNPADQQLVDQEAQRLSATNPIRPTTLKVSELNHYQIQPNAFLNQLDGLNGDFEYRVKQFSYQANDAQTSVIAIQLEISKTSAKAQIVLTKTVNVVDDRPQLPTNEALVRAIEYDRLNRMINSTALKQTTFSSQTINELYQQPNKIFGLLSGFVMQQYFHYRISDLQITNGMMTFAIEAKLWKATNLAIIIKSKSFSFPIRIETETHYQPDIVNYQWAIKPVSHASGDADNGYDLTYDLQSDSKLDLAKIDWNNGVQLEQLVQTIISQDTDKFVVIEGQIDPKWTWQDNLVIIDFAPQEGITPAQVTAFTTTAYVLNTNSQDLDEQLILNLTFSNGYNSGQVNQPPSASELWDRGLAQFQDLIQAQAFDDRKIHSGAINGVQSFSQITIDKPIASDHFSNFLNFSPTEFWKATNFLIKPSVKNVTINYLTNTVQFQWVLQGDKQLANRTWESSLQTITYQPNPDWQDPIPVATTGALAIANATPINGILDRFSLSNQFRSHDLQKELLARFSQNWTWKAREFANYVRFTFYQAFNNGADLMNMAIADLPTASFDHNPAGYTIILKAQLNATGAGMYLPYLQMFGAAANISSRQWQAGDVIEIRLRVDNVAPVADVVSAAAEILPGFGTGHTWGHGQGYEAIYLNQPPRTDLFGIFLGKTTLTINHNGRPYLNPTPAVHRFLSLNLMARYNFKDPIWQAPPLSDNWIDA